MPSAASSRWLCLTFAVIAADRATKFLIERRTPDGYMRELVPGTASLVHSFNSGIAFGFFSGSAPRWAALLLIAISSLIVVLLGWILVSGRAGGTLPHAGLALIMGGAIGNLIDRVLHGGVTDFIELRAGSFRWPAFNLADTAITVGSVLLIFALLGGEHRAASERV
jgi:signal peptidase II